MAVISSGHFARANNFGMVSYDQINATRSGRFLENCDLAVHEIGKGTGARHRKRG